MSLEPIEIEVRRATPVSIGAAVVCWLVFLVGGIVLPSSAALNGLLAEVSLFGWPPTRDQIAEQQRLLIAGAASATVTAMVLLACALGFRVRGRVLISAWVTAVAVAVVAVSMWVLVAVV